MATEIQRILIKYETDVKAVVAGAEQIIDANEGIVDSEKDVAKEGKKAFSSVQGEVKNTQSSLKGLTSSLASVGVAIAAAFSVREIVAFAQQSVKLADIQLKAEAQLLKALGGREDIQNRLLKSAADLQKQTIFGDEAIIQQQAFLASLGFSEDKINDVIKASVDLSAATGLTLEGSVRNLAKTYSGLSGELGELIPQLRGLTAEELQAGEGVRVATQLFKGQAEVLAQTGTGPIVQLQNAFGDLREELGKVVIEALPLLISTLKTTTNAIGEITKEVDEDLQPSFQKLFDSLVELRDAGNQLSDTLGIDVDNFNLLDGAVTVVNAKLLPFIQAGRLIVEVWNQAAIFIGNVADNINDTTNAVTDFLGITTEAERAYNRQARQAARDAEDIAKQRQQNTATRINQEKAALDALSAIFDKGEEEVAKPVADAIVKAIPRALQDPRVIAETQAAIDALQKQIELTEFRLKFGVDPEGIDLIGETFGVEPILAQVDALDGLEEKIIEVGDQKVAQSERIINSIQAEIQAEELRAQRTGQAINSTIQIFDNLGATFAKNAEAQRRIALFQIAINQALAVAEAAKAGAGIPFPGNIPAILAGIAAVTAAFAQVKQLEAQAPGFAVGTSDAPGGLALVGERGPEYVSLPRGARVFTADASKKERSLIDALNAGKHEEFIHDHYLKPFAAQLARGNEGWSYDDFQLRQAIRSNKVIELGPKTLRKLNKGQKKVYH